MTNNRDEVNDHLVSNDANIFDAILKINKTADIHIPVFDEYGKLLYYYIAFLSNPTEAGRLFDMIMIVAGTVYQYQVADVVDILKSLELGHQNLQESKKWMFINGVSLELIEAATNNNDKRQLDALMFEMKKRGMKQ